MFKWIARKLKKASQEIDREDIEEVSYSNKPMGKLSSPMESDENDDPIRFELTSAVGGRILRVRRYDRRSHESDSQLYVIPQGEDVGERVSKIVNLELLN